MVLFIQYLDYIKKHTEFKKQEYFIHDQQTTPSVEGKSVIRLKKKIIHALENDQKI